MGDKNNPSYCDGHKHTLCHHNSARYAAVERSGFVPVTNCHKIQEISSPGLSCGCNKWNGWPSPHTAADHLGLTLKTQATIAWERGFDLFLNERTLDYLLFPSKSFRVLQALFLRYYLPTQFSGWNWYLLKVFSWPFRFWNNVSAAVWD